MQDEREQLRHIFKKAIEYHATDCKESFKWWNSVWNDNGGGGAPGLFWKMTGSSATMMLPVTQGNLSLDNHSNFLKLPSTAAAMH